MSDTSHANEKHIIDYLMHAATRTDIADLRNETKSDIARLDDKFDRELEKIDARFDKLDKKIDSNFKWTLGLLIPIMLSGFAGLYYKDMNNSPSTQSPHVATVQQK